MTTSYEFRKATWKEKHAIFGLYRHVMGPYIDGIWGWDPHWQEDDFDTHFVPEHIIVVFAGNTLAGYAQTEDQGDHLFMRMLLVAADHQHKGVGSELIDMVKNAAKAGSKGVKLEVFKLNDNALGFYEHHGFRVASSTDNSFVMTCAPDD